MLWQSIKSFIYSEWQGRAAWRLFCRLDSANQIDAELMVAISRWMERRVEDSVAKFRAEK